MNSRIYLKERDSVSDDSYFSDKQQQSHVILILHEYYYTNNSARQLFCLAGSKDRNMKHDRHRPVGKKKKQKLGKLLRGQVSSSRAQLLKNKPKIK